jgi:hypothetical protein
VPNVKELQSIVNYENANPSVSSAFNTNCVAGCTSRTCSCTFAGFKWSATTYAYNPSFALFVWFYDGSVSATPKSNSSFGVRAVRGGY